MLGFRFGWSALLSQACFLLRVKTVDFARLGVLSPSIHRFVKNARALPEILSLRINFLVSECFKLPSSVSELAMNLSFFKQMGLVLKLLENN
jgi:hypothetical protein